MARRQEAYRRLELRARAAAAAAPAIPAALRAEPERLHLVDEHAPVRVAQVARHVLEDAQQVRPVRGLHEGRGRAQPWRAVMVGPGRARVQERRWRGFEAARR